MKVYCIHFIKHKKNEKSELMIGGIYSSEKEAEKAITKNIFICLDDKHYNKIKNQKTFVNKINEYTQITGNEIYIIDYMVNSDSFFENIYPY